MKKQIGLLFNDQSSLLSNYFHLLVKCCFFPLNVNFQSRKISFNLISWRMFILLFIIGIATSLWGLGLYISCGIENYFKAGRLMGLWSGWKRKKIACQKHGITFGVICKEVALAVLHCVNQWDDLTNLVQHS